MNVGDLRAALNEATSNDADVLVMADGESLAISGAEVVDGKFVLYSGVPVTSETEGLNESPSDNSPEG